MPDADCTQWPPNPALIQVPDVSAADALSRAGARSFKVTGSSNALSSDPGNPEIVIMPDGSGGFLVHLRADRLGSGVGRVYTLTATADDSAGNTAVATAG